MDDSDAIRRLIADLEAGFNAAPNGQFARYELGEISFLRPDVAVAHMRAQATDEAGEPIDVGHSMVTLYVFVRDDGSWRVAAQQSTLVRP
jgi:uncharacterized protein (TIGR02246 family)